MIVITKEVKKAFLKLLERFQKCVCVGGCLYFFLSFPSFSEQIESWEWKCVKIKCGFLYLFLSL